MYLYIFLTFDKIAAKVFKGDTSFSPEDGAARKCLSPVFHQLCEACVGRLDEVEQHTRYDGDRDKVEAGDDLLCSLPPVYNRSHQ